MKLQVNNLSQNSLKTAKAIAVIFNKTKKIAELNSNIKIIDKHTNGKISSLIESGYFKSGFNPLSQPIYLEKNNYSHLFVLEISNQLDSYQFINKIDDLAARVVSSHTKKVILSFEGLKVIGMTKSQINQQIALSFARASYRFDYHKSKKTKKNLQIVSLVDCNSEIKNQLTETNALISGINLCKDLANEPSNVCTPTFFAETAKKLAKDSNNTLSCTILDEKQMKALKMGSLLSVAKGSIQTPKMVFLSYQGAQDSNKKPIALVGKGVCFDSGGISIKPSAAMDEMKYDMCGAASVIGVLKTISEAQLKINVVGVMALVENMPSARATKPGDIVRAYNGTTIEVLNTDAEGRLVLADALSYTIEKYQPEKIIDIATLTGAVVMALGSVYCANLTNDSKLSNELIEAGNESLDLSWQLPLHSGYKEQLKSNFADLPNISNSRYAGTITAAHFLEDFTKGSRWAHLDIAGVSWNSASKKGATGRPVNLLYHFIKQNQT